ncbi:MAG: archease [Candidatus Heimdallarchaeum endolithica]|uniref:Archease n=1 Tax=Candidatus Heimdallarchaeum endolithica TaxID=2876572 RepID=A0A9Y1FMU1_9ARCH|nr:MAG: archease [Candidatus Heimdallarchaeum endolithica]
MGNYRLLENETTGDFAFEAYGSSLEELFKYAGLATMSAMVDLSQLQGKQEYSFEIESPNLNMLFYEFLSELIFVKDVKMVFFTDFEIQIRENSGYKLHCKAKTTPIDNLKQDHFTDVKAATMHHLIVEKQGEQWYCKAILDL